MTSRRLEIDETVYEYLLASSLREHPVMAELRAVTAKHRLAGMQIGPEQGQFMALLVRLIGARRALEVGVFTGYSTLAVALALPDDGRVVACDLSAEYTAIAREFWERAGVAHKIDLRLAPAVNTLDELIAEDQAGSFDFAFIDADKTGYDTYYERCLKLVRSGGLIAIDNVLWGGRVAYPAPAHDASTSALQTLNAKLRDDPRIELSMLPIGDGLTLAMKR